MRAAHVETERRPTPRAPAAWSPEKVRPGVQDEAADPARVVAIESFWIRYQDEYIWLHQDAPAEERFLSCSLNIAWPDPALSTVSGSDEEAWTTLKALGDAFECDATRDGSRLLGEQHRRPAVRRLAQLSRHPSRHGRLRTAP